MAKKQASKRAPSHGRGYKMDTEKFFQIWCKAVQNRWDREQFYAELQDCFDGNNKGKTFKKVSAYVKMRHINKQLGKRGKVLPIPPVRYRGRKSLNYDAIVRDPTLEELFLEHQS